MDPSIVVPFSEQDNGKNSGTTQQLELALSGMVGMLAPLESFQANYLIYVSVQFSSVAQSCPTLCDPMNCSMPGLPVHHQLPEFTQTHVYQVSDAIQPSHPLLSPSPPVPNPSQHQSLFQWVNSLYEVAVFYCSFSFGISQMESLKSPTLSGRFFTSSATWEAQVL